MKMRVYFYPYSNPCTEKSIVGVFDSIDDAWAMGSKYGYAFSVEYLE